MAAWDHDRNIRGGGAVMIFDVVLRPWVSMRSQPLIYDWLTTGDGVEEDTELRLHRSVIVNINTGQKHTWS